MEEPFKGSFFGYVGGKNRLAPVIAEYLHATGRPLLVDVFGGSAAVTLRAGFKKRIYNDVDADLVNLFRVLADSDQRVRLLRKLKALPPSRQIFEDFHAEYVRGGLSFSRIECPVDRAVALFYKQCFAFGGKLKNGGFQLSIHDAHHIKEVPRYRNRLKCLAEVGRHFSSIVLENKDYQTVIANYGRSREAVLFIDPPYFGTEHYYSHQFTRADHIFLAEMLNTCSAPSVLTYYDRPELRDLYPAPQWEWIPVRTVKNSNRTDFGSRKQHVDEMIVRRLDHAAR